MRATALVTRFRDGAFEGDACLLAYDETDLSGAVVSSDVRDVLNSRPNTWKIYVVAPFLAEDVVIRAALYGTAHERAGGKIAVLVARIVEGSPLKLTFLHRPAEGGEVEEDTRASDDLVQGWLFSLFEQSRALVDAPAGVHFGKGSGKHASHFLRASSVLLSSVACAVIALVALTRLAVGVPRRIFVDTAPLIAVAQAMQRIARMLDYWQFSQPIISFSSYGGIDRAPTMGFGDVAIVSASTSGSLAARLVDMGITDGNLVTLFLLKSPSGSPSPGSVVCNLTAAPDRTFGFSPIESFSADSCPSCRRGDLLAELAGDQFLLEKRGIKRLRVSTASQKEAARKFFDREARTRRVLIQPYASDAISNIVRFDIDRMAREDSEVAQSVVRLLRRFTPSPLHAIVMVGIEEGTVEHLFDLAGMRTEFVSTRRVPWQDLDSLEPVDGGSMLVFAGCLDDHGRMRGINATMRTKAPQGNVAYLSVVTLADSPRNLGDLRMFLSYGQYGAETFIFRSAYEVMLPWHQELSTAWDDELELLQRLASDGSLDARLSDRLRQLEGMSCESNGLFIPGSCGELQIAADFVYLDTTVDRLSITQADVLAVVSNLLATMRCNDSGLPAQGARIPAEAMQWNQSLYGQVLLAPASLCPRNMRDYNDAILRAAFLRTARKQELNYSIDEHISAEVLDVILADLAGWPGGRGDSLPEWMMSLATGRLRLHPFHVARFVAAASAANLPNWLAQILACIGDD